MRPRSRTQPDLRVPQRDGRVIEERRELEFNAGLRSSNGGASAGAPSTVIAGRALRTRWAPVTTRRQHFDLDDRLREHRGGREACRLVFDHDLPMPLASRNRRKETWPRCRCVTQPAIRTRSPRARELARHDSFHRLQLVARPFLVVRREAFRGATALHRAFTGALVRVLHSSGSSRRHRCDHDGTIVGGDGGAFRSRLALAAVGAISKVMRIRPNGASRPPGSGTPGRG